MKPTSDATAVDGTSPVSVEEVSVAVRHWRIRFAGAPLADLFWEQDDAGSRCRLYFDGDLKAEVMRQVLDGLAPLLAELPAGRCVVQRGHLVSSIDFGEAR
jgi:hypothetical protein